jgi:uncharacterized protein (DUF1697 family)
MSKAAKTYVAFLRGINVGGNTIISMADLKRYFELLGFENVTTYINSGNVVFSSSIGDERKLERDITKALIEHFDKEIAAVVIDSAGIDELLHSIPASWHKKGDEKRNVIFLRHSIDKPEILDSFTTKPGIESLRYVPRALLWSAKTSDLTRSNMVKLSSSPLYKEMTVRTLGTVQKVQTIMQRSVI